MNAPAPPVMNVPEDMNALALSEMNASAEMNAPDDTNGMEPDERDMIIAEILKSAPDDTNEMEPDERDMIIDEILKSPDSKLSTRASTSGSMHSSTTLGGSSSTKTLSSRLHFDQNITYRNMQQHREPLGQEARRGRLEMKNKNQQRWIESVT